MLSDAHTCISIYGVLCILPNLHVGVPRLERKHVRAWYLFSRDHDVIKTGPELLEQKGNAFRVVQPTMRSTLNI